MVLKANLDLLLVKYTVYKVRQNFDPVKDNLKVVLLWVGLPQLSLTLILSAHILILD